MSTELDLDDVAAQSPLAMRELAALRDFQPTLLAWAVRCWRAEVQDRPLVNKHRRTLDDTWRQVMRYAGGDPDELVGPAHDALIELAMVDAGGDKRAGPSAPAVGAA